MAPKARFEHQTWPLNTMVVPKLHRALSAPGGFVLLKLLLLPLGDRDTTCGIVQFNQLPTVVVMLSCCCNCPRMGGSEWSTNTMSLSQTEGLAIAANQEATKPPWLGLGPTWLKHCSLCETVPGVLRLPPMPSLVPALKGLPTVWYRN